MCIKYHLCDHSSTTKKKLKKFSLLEYFYLLIFHSYAIIELRSIKEEEEETRNYNELPFSSIAPSSTLTHFLSYAFYDVELHKIQLFKEFIVKKLREVNDINKVGMVFFYEFLD